MSGHEHSVRVVEDEKPLAQIVADYLTKAGYEATQVHTGPDGVTAAREVDPTSSFST